MSLSLGARLGSYEILSAIGAGGMGEVYRARDTKLERDVALKVLPEAFARDAARMARFGREAKLLAALDHPNIAAIYGLEDSGGTRALVMQLADGSTLADRITKGPIPIEEALPIARQITEALEYAHERGIIHRDLKPANVKVAADGTVKLLDFGLAKAMDSDLSGEDLANSPTLSRMATQAGVLLGTAAYMSPDQAKGKPVDRRGDIWAFGCVLYEMLTGKMAFDGDSVTDTLSAVIRVEPDWSKLPAATPVRVRVLLHRCLQKDPKQRLRDIGDARISLDEVMSGAADPAPSVPVATQPLRNTRQIRLAWTLAGILLVVAGTLAFLYFREKPKVVSVTRFEIPMPQRTTFTASLALSPNGRRLTFVATDTNGQVRLWVRSFDNIEARPLEGTEGAGGFMFWSPDSRFIAFFAQGRLKKVDASGGPALMICETPSLIGGAWSPDDKIVFSSAGRVMQVPAAGGSPTAIIASGVFPSLLPDGQHFLYTKPPAGNANEDSGIYVGAVATEPARQPQKRLLPDVSPVLYEPASRGPAGYLLFTRGASAQGPSGTLMAQPFDPRRLETTGEAIAIAEGVSITDFSASTDVLAYVSGQRTIPPGVGGVRGVIDGQLAWFDRAGHLLGTFGEPGSYRTLALSHDGKRLAVERLDVKNPNIWLYEFERGVMTRFTVGSGWYSGPVWSWDDSHIAFALQSTASGFFDIYKKASDMSGNQELMFESKISKLPSSWSHDGQSMLYHQPTSPTHVWLLQAADGAERKPVQMEQSDYDQAYGRFSPDGRWIAYTSNESGRNEIYVRPFDASLAKASSPETKTPVSSRTTISKGGGGVALWSHDGKELFYRALDGTAMVVDVNTSGGFHAGIPQPLFKMPPGVQFFDVSPDGKRFVMAQPSPANASKFTVTLNWQTALTK
jgi:Tol biopolymer transport system component